MDIFESLSAERQNKEKLILRLALQMAASHENILLNGDFLQGMIYGLAIRDNMDCVFQNGDEAWKAGAAHVLYWLRLVREAIDEPCSTG